MKNEELTFEKVLAAFEAYLAQDDCAEIVKTSRGYAVIEWDNRQNSWVQINHCPTPTVLKEMLLDTMASFLEFCYTSGDRDLTEAERQQITRQQELLVENVGVPIAEKDRKG